MYICMYVCVYVCTYAYICISSIYSHDNHNDCPVPSHHIMFGAAVFTVVDSQDTVRFSREFVDCVNIHTVEHFENSHSDRRQHHTESEQKQCTISTLQCQHGDDTVRR